MSDELDPWLPTKDRLEKTLGDHHQVASLFQRDWRCEELAAVVLMGRALRHDSWSADVELSESDFRKVERRRPSEEMRERSYQLLDRTVEPKQQRCSSCAVTRGRNPCGTCLGSGRIVTGDSSYRCPECIGSFVTCTTCSGAEKTWQVRMLYVTDTIVDFREVLLPELPERHRRPMLATLKHAGVPTAAMKIDLEGDSRRSAYRGKVSQSFHGWRFGKAIGRAEQFIERVQRLPSIGAVQHVAYAWPILLATIGARELCFVVTEHGPRVSGL